MTFGNVPNVLLELIRTVLIPKPNYRFIVADFSAIEARVLSWLAGEQWRLDTFRNGGDIYCASASQMFRVPVEKHGVNGHLRQKGKISELACGYGGSVGALKNMGAVEMGVPEEELQGLINDWRNANPHIVKLWTEVGNADNRPADSELISKVKEHIEENRPIGAEVTVVSASPVMINISVRLTADNTSNIQTTVENVLKDYLSGEAIKKEYISYAKIGSLILSRLCHNK